MRRRRRRNRGRKEESGNHHAGDRDGSNRSAGYGNITALYRSLTVMRGCCSEELFWR